MKYHRMPIEIESPEQLGYDTIRNNLSESSYTDARLKDLPVDFRDLRELALCYGDHAGHPGLRKLLAERSGVLSKEEILLTVGAAAGLFMIATALLERGDEMVVVRPNYATNIATPQAIGATVRFVDLHFEDGYRIDINAVRKLVTRQTKYISVTHPHNPTGVCLEEADLKALASMAEEQDSWLLVDETYRDLVFAGKLPLACAYSDRVISVSSLSKTYGLPGIRMGWIGCRNQKMRETLLAAKEQIHICGSVLDEELAWRWLRQEVDPLERIRKDVQEKFQIVAQWMQAQDDLEWVVPGGGVVCFPRVKRPDRFDADRFYGTLLREYGTYVGPGHWFDCPRHSLRIGYGWPSPERLQEGLDAISKCLRSK